jgi:hypothetical protein
MGRRQGYWRNYALGLKLSGASVGTGSSPIPPCGSREAVFSTDSLILWKNAEALKTNFGPAKTHCWRHAQGLLYLAGNCNTRSGCSRIDGGF